LSRLHLLDTNILSALVKDPHGRIAGKVLKAGLDNICTSAIVAAELHYGAAKAKLVIRRRVEELLGQEIEVLPFDHAAAQEYGKLRMALQKDGVGLSANDLLIAAHANAISAPVVTADAGFKQASKHVRILNWAA
jgi:tRNA(fMet)-specific endonuclease VapC